jgi:hypothetical protein
MQTARLTSLARAHLKFILTALASSIAIARPAAAQTPAFVNFESPQVHPIDITPDRASDPSLTPAALLALAAQGSELTYTLVPIGTRTRLGIDRDLDGFRDRDELDAGSDPSDPTSVPGGCEADISPEGGDGFVNGQDLAFLLSTWGAPGIGDLDGNGITDGGDLAVLLGSWGSCQ